jgi:citrate synthase
MPTCCRHGRPSDRRAAAVVSEAKAGGRLVPGLGHPVHKVQDPRTPVLLDLARQHGTFGDHLELLVAIGRVHPEILGRQLPLNGAGVCGAVLADVGLPLSALRGCALLARCAGLLGHLAEEEADPLGMEVYLEADRNIDYDPPPG